MTTSSSTVGPVSRNRFPYANGWQRESFTIVIADLGESGIVTTQSTQHEREQDDK